MGSVENVCLGVYRGPADPGTFEAFGDLLGDVVAEFGKAVIVTVVHPGAINLTPQARERAAEVAKRYAESTAATLDCFLVDGVLGMALRMLVTAIRLPSASAHPRKVVGDLDSGLSWLATTDPRLSALRPALAEGLAELDGKLARS